MGTDLSLRSLKSVGISMQKHLGILIVQEHPSGLCLASHIVPRLPLLQRVTRRLLVLILLDKTCLIVLEIVLFKRLHT